jgi:putative ABC transport system permease protein
MHGIADDLRFALRVLLKNPVFAVAALLCLGLGIGGNTAIFNVLYSVVLRPLPYESAERLVVVEQRREGEFYSSFSPADYLDMRELSRTMGGLAGRRAANLSLRGAGAPERVRAESVSPSFFRIFGVEPVLGRFFLPQDDPAEAGVRSVVLSYRAWQSRYGGDAAVIGLALTLNGEPHTVVGVAPATFEYPEDAEMWVRSYRYGVPEPPVDLGEDLSLVRDLGYFGVIGRLAEGVTLDVGRAEMEVIAERLREVRGGEAEEVALRLVPLHEDLVGHVRPALLVLLCAVGFVLLIACANVSSLLLARSSAREREIAVRAALGARRTRLARQLLTESLLLGVLGGVLGLLLAIWGVDALLRLAPSDLPRLTGVEIHGPVLVFALVLSLLTGTLFGLLPALQASKPNLAESLKEGGRSATEGRRARRLSELLVISEVALSLVLLCGTGLLLKSLRRLQAVDLGFQPENVLVMRLTLPGTRYSEGEQRIAFVREITERVGGLPGVTSASIVLALPFSGTAATLTYLVEGVTASDEELATDYQVITPDYFRTIGIPLLRGRMLTDDDNADAPRVAVINETLARRHWPGEDPLGRRIAIGDESNSLEIVGVVGDVRHFSHDRRPRPEAYVSYYQDPWPMLGLVVRAETDPLSLAAAVRREILAVDSDQPVYAVNVMDRVLADSIRPRRFTAQVLGLFAGVAIALALVGVYGVISYTLSRRVHEMGIRMALGAGQADVLHVGLGWGLKLVLLGVGIGLVAATALTRFISSLLYGTSATDPAVFLATSVMLTAAAALAAYVPAQRAARLDPLAALRYE